MIKHYFVILITLFISIYSSELTHHTMTYCMECSKSYIDFKQNITGSEIEDFRVYFDFNKLYYRKLDFDREIYPYYVEVLLEDKQRRLRDCMLE